MGEPLITPPPPVVERCLWVRDARAKQRRRRWSDDPESVRCRPDGHVFCTPCLDAFRASGHLPYPDGAS